MSLHSPTSRIALLLASTIGVLSQGCKGPSTGSDSTGSGGASSTAMAGAAGQRVDLKGWRIIGCCCAAPCPCRLNKKPMLCHGCDHTDVVYIDKGSIGGTRMDGVSWALVGRVFGEKKEQNWTYVYVSDQATDEQVKALQGMLESDLKQMGPKSAHLAGEFKGMRKVPLLCAVTSDRREYKAAIPGILEFQTRAIVVPGHQEPVMSTGIQDAFGDRFVHADPVVHTYNDPQIGYSWNLTGRQANQADFLLTNERIAKGGIGWGCWTAHSELQDPGNYQERMLDHK